ncbi:MAG: ABC transporter permease [Lachnospiraceae bacterium]|nr:ABC transporter permease [Lachnospiraceae bacterium]
MENGRSRKKTKKRAFSLLADLYVVAMYTLFYIPVAVMIAFSFNDAKRNFSWEGFTTSWYAKLFSFQNTTLWDALIYSLIIAVLATVISTVVGVLGGIGLKKFEFRTKKFINMMIYVPIIVPEIVLAVAMLIIFITVGFKMGMGTILIGHCTFCIPYAVVTIKGRISGDNETLEEASMDLGANRIQTFLRVTIPSIMPGIMSSAFLCFTLSIDDVVMSNMLAGASQSTLPVLILSLNRTGLTGDVNALTTVMIAVMVLALLAQNMIRSAVAKSRAKRLSEAA